MKKNKGLIPVLMTPFNKNGSIDFIGLKNLIEFLDKKKIGGYWVLGTGGEDMNLSFSQRMDIFEAIYEINQDRKPIFIGASFNEFSNTVNFIKQLNRYKIKGGVHYMIYNSLSGEKSIYNSYKRLADISTNSLWIYTSANWGKYLDPKIISDLKEYPNITGVKFSTSNTNDMNKVANLSDDSFTVFSAVISTFYSCLCNGVDGSTSSLGSSIPEAILEIYDTYQKKNYKKALTLQRKLNQFLSLMNTSAQKNNFLKSAEEKTILEIRGICKRHVSFPFIDCKKSEKKYLQELINKFYPKF